MNFATVVGRGQTGGEESGYVAGDNLTGAVCVPGEAVCFSHTASDGKSFVDPVLAAVGNPLMFAGIVQDTLGTGSHGVLKRYGLASVLVSGGADVLPGVHLGLVHGTPVMGVVTAAQWAGTALTAQVPRVTCLGTVTAGQGVTTVVKSFINF